MDFRFTEEQKQIRELARRVASEEIAPGAREREERGEYPWDVVEIFKRHRIYALFIPEEYGGISYSLVNQCIVMEEVSRVCNNAGAMLSFNILGPYPIILAGDEEQKRKYLPQMALGEILGAYALTEPEAGSDAASLKTEAVLRGDHYVINGEKCFISHFDVAKVVILFARTNPVEKPSRGISAFIVDKLPGEVIPGFKEVRSLPKMSMKAVHTYSFSIEELQVPSRNLLGREGEGFSIAMKTLDRGRILCGAQAVGTAQGAFDIALNFARNRRQFGRVIASFQAILFMLVDMRTEIEAARLLVYKAASTVDKGEEGVSLYGAMAKRFATDVAMKVTTDAVQVLGGYGYLRDFHVERLMRDAKAMQIYEGTNQIQRLVIGRELLRNSDL